MHYSTIYMPFSCFQDLAIINILTKKIYEHIYFAASMSIIMLAVIVGVKCWVIEYLLFQL